MSKILLTGAKGFIGSYFVNRYKDKYEIQTFSFANDDLERINFEEISTIIHLSALVHQMHGASTEEYEKVNVVQTLSLAKKAKIKGVKHFIFMSTVKVYGEETQIPYDENTVCLPQDDYGKSKFKAEQELQKLESEDFKVSIIRTPIVYGYGVKANIKNLISLVKKVPILPFANINNKRSMVYIGNLCHLIDEVVRQKKEGVFLSSDDKSLSTTDFVRYLTSALNKKSYLIEIPFFANILQLIKPTFYQRLYKSLEINNSVTKDRLDLKNPYSVEEGITLMISGEGR